MIKSMDNFAWKVLIKALECWNLCDAVRDVRVARREVRQNPLNEQIATRFMEAKATRNDWLRRVLCLEK